MSEYKIEDGYEEEAVKLPSVEGVKMLLKKHRDERKEYIKVVNRKCQDCGKHVNILCNEKCQIVAVRCPECFQMFLISTIEVKQLQSYLKKKGWEEVQIERKEVIKICSPHPTFSVFIPARKDLVDYVVVVKQSIKSIAGYEGKAVDDVMIDVLKEGKE